MRDVIWLERLSKKLRGEEVKVVSNRELFSLRMQVVDGNVRQRLWMRLRCNGKTSIIP